MDNNEINSVTSTHSIAEYILCFPPSLNSMSNSISSARSHSTQEMTAIKILSLVFSIDAIVHSPSCLIRHY